MLDKIYNSPHSTSRSFLQTYMNISNLSKSHGLSWYVPGLIQPFHALIILLMHLNSCSRLEEETDLGQDLVNQVFSVRFEHMITWSDIPVRAIMLEEERPGNTPMSNPRYKVLWDLRRKVWQKLGWSWPSVKALQRDLMSSTSMQQANDRAYAQAAKKNTSPHDDEYGGSPIMAALDDELLHSDPMDFFKWNEWNPSSPDFSPL